MKARILKLLNCAALVALALGLSAARGTGGTSAICLVHTKTIVQPADRSHTAVLNTVLIDDKDFCVGCLQSLERALDILRRLADDDRTCNLFFRTKGDRRLLKDFLEDSRIRIHYDPVQDYSDEGPTIAYTREGNKRDIYVQPYACRLSRWELARALVHEFTHITLTPGSGQEQEAQLMESHCGFRKRVVTPPITVTASPTRVPVI